LQQKCDFGKLQVYSASVFRVTNNGFESWNTTRDRSWSVVSKRTRSAISFIISQDLNDASQSWEDSSQEIISEIAGWNETPMMDSKEIKRLQWRRFGNFNVTWRVAAISGFAKLGVSYPKWLSGIRYA
jgi:hypothetical protein